MTGVATNSNLHDPVKLETHLDATASKGRAAVAAALFNNVSTIFFNCIS